MQIFRKKTGSNILLLSLLRLLLTGIITKPKSEFVFISHFESHMTTYLSSLNFKLLADFKY